MCISDLGGVDIFCDSIGTQLDVGKLNVNGTRENLHGNLRNEARYSAGDNRTDGGLANNTAGDHCGGNEGKEQMIACQKAVARMSVGKHRSNRIDAGKNLRARLSAYRPLTSARQVNFLGETLSDLPVEQGKVLLDITGFEWIEVEARWEASKAA